MLSVLSKRRTFLENSWFDLVYREEGMEVYTDCRGKEHRPSSNFITEKAGSDGNDKVVNVEDTILSKRRYLHIT